MIDIATWLKQLGLERYEAAFRDNEITDDILRAYQNAVAASIWAEASPSAARSQRNIAPPSASSAAP